MASLAYESGSIEENTPYVFRFDLSRAGFYVDHSYGVTQIIELWCEHFCSAPWRIEKQDHFLTIGFAADLDAVVFHLSGEYGRLVGSIIERPAVQN